jgi:hypothetical protein
LSTISFAVAASTGSADIRRTRGVPVGARSNLGEDRRLASALNERSVEAICISLRGDPRDVVARLGRRPLVHANGGADGPREHDTASTEGVHAV